MNLLERIEQIKPYQLNCNVFSVYDYDGVTMQELLSQFFKKINNCIDVSNKTINLAEWLVNEGLKEEVAKKLELWLIDGTLGKIINEVLLKELEEKVETNIDNIDKLKDTDKLHEKEIEKLKDKNILIDSNINLLNEKDRLIEKDIDLLNKKDEEQDKRLELLEKDGNGDLPVKTVTVETKSLTQMIKDLHKLSNENNSKNILRVGTFNVLSFRDRDVSTTTKVAYHILREKLDVCCIQEFIDYYTFVSQWWIKIPNAYDYISFNPLWKCDGGFAGMAILGKPQLTNLVNGNYNKVEGYENRGYQKAEITINGKKVSIYNTHLTHNSDEILRQEMQQLANVVKNDTNTHKIVCGDFNAYFEHNFEAFTSIGFKPVVPLVTKTIDNILIPNNVKVKDYYKTPLDEKLSDHAMVVAELEVL